MSKTIDVWWIRWGSTGRPCSTSGLAITPSELPHHRPDVWFSKQEVLNDPRVPTYLKSRFTGEVPHGSWELVCTPIEFKEEELNEALHH